MPKKSNDKVFVQILNRDIWERLEEQGKNTESKFDEHGKILRRIEDKLTESISRNETQHREMTANSDRKFAEVNGKVNGIRMIAMGAVAVATAVGGWLAQHLLK